ncbi:uncharacterized protein LOC111196789 [Astyanax mexicanus]|uniref:uncharacterized protein LOC111196789 n=1 Tax=Astyanax mexicanus TaxID=7994 RepID=UPI0020CA9E5C|nr:uncharacterized protein LOC111196789 [Astyanax mexicanus]
MASGDRFTSSLLTLPRFGQEDVVRLVNEHSQVKGSKLDKGYKLFFEQFIFNYRVSDLVNDEVVVQASCYRSMRKREEPHTLQVVLHAVHPVALNGFCCSCAAGKALCNHVVALLFQTAHYSTMGVKTVAPPLPCTSVLQTWHRPRTQGIRPEPIDEFVVRKPRASGRSCVKSTLYRAYPGPLPDPAVLSAGDCLRDLRPQPGICKILCGLTNMTLVDSKFGLVPHGSVLSYQCPPVVTREISKHPEAPLFPQLPLNGYKLEKQLHFVPNSHQFYHLESLEVTTELSSVIEKNTREQSESPLWKQVRQPRLTSSRFGEVFKVQGESSSQALAARILKGVRQTPAMKRGIDLEPEVLQQYSDLCNVNVSPCGFVIHPDTPYLGASPDAKVYDPTADPPFGLAEVKCPNVENITDATHIKFISGQAKLKRTHKYFLQVQGQMAITGLAWCDFITSTKSDLTVERVWRDDSLLAEMKEKLDLFYLNTYMNSYLNMN